jgi:biotin carboxyl carrier protein
MEGKKIGEVMSLYTVTIGSHTYKVNISGDRNTVDGQDVDARMVQLNQNGLQLLHHGKQAHEVFLSTQETDTYQMNMFGGRRIITRITNRFGKRARACNDADGASCLSAPMHGLVVDVPVKEGEAVTKGQTLVVLESMKMQMQLRSPRDGKVAKVTVQAGNQVEKGALLVQFE